MLAMALTRLGAGTVEALDLEVRADAREFLAVAAQIPLRTHVQIYPLRDANRALNDLRAGRLSGAAVLEPGSATASFKP